MNVDRMRIDIISVYSGGWKNKVDRMDDSQVIAIWHELVKRGKLSGYMEAGKVIGYGYELKAQQLSMFDLL